ncbi:hypothetical protein Mgra_00003924 [Meloidogyne graminicola]|uniref:Uncharacterized protein n=1 Tax=Meloidogyne graminicola TaxID=189291 RepID=A0A8S9ZST0_9BILA|nr:hypothetical protein Mgra_00003924 [Meloidogyne graminicola]
MDVEGKEMKEKRKKMDASTAVTSSNNNNLFGNMEQKFDLAALLRNVAAAAAVASSSNTNGSVPIVASTLSGSTSTSPNSVESSAPSSSTVTSLQNNNNAHPFLGGESLPLNAGCSGAITNGGSSSRSSTPSTNNTTQQTPQRERRSSQRRSPIPALSLAPPGVLRRHQLPFTPIQPIYAPSGHGRQILIYDSRSHPGRRREFAYKTRFTNQSGLTTVYYRCMACRALRHRLQRTLSKDRLPAVPCIAVKNDLLMNDPDFPEASDHFCSPLTIGESNQRLKNTFERGHKRARMKMANSAVEETIRKVSKLAMDVSARGIKSEVKMEDEGNGTPLIDAVEINKKFIFQIILFFLITEETDDSKMHEQLICEIDILKNNNPDIKLNKEKITEKYNEINNDILINNQNSFQIKKESLLIAKSSLIQKNGPFYSSTINSSFPQNIQINGNNNNGIIENNECFNFNAPILSAVLAAMIRNSQATQNQNIHQQQHLNQNFQENINSNNNSMPTTPTCGVQNNNSIINNIKRKGAIVNGILQKLSNKATAEAHNISLIPQQLKMPKEINKKENEELNGNNKLSSKKELRKREIKTKRSFVSVQTQTEISGEIETKKCNYRA